MSYSADEIQASVEQLVLSSIRRPYDTLGTRRVDVSFTDVQEAAAGLFLTTTSAPFYISFLGAQRLLDIVAGEVVLVGFILDAIKATGRSVFPVDDLTPLGNARSALFELEAAVTNRDRGFKSIDTVPAYQRFQSNLSDFLSKQGPNIKEQGQIVQTPQEARGALGGFITELRDSHLELVRKVTVLAGALDDFAKVNLPALAASGVISKARKLLDGDLTKLEALGDKERLAILRPIILDLLTSKAVVKKYGSFLSPPTFLTLTGTGQLFADASHPAIPAGANGNTSSPFSIISKQNVVDVMVETEADQFKVNGNVDSTSLSFNGPQLVPFRMEFNRAAGSFVTDGVVVGDVLYIFGGGLGLTSWLVTSVTANVLQAMGSVPAQALGTTFITIWRKPDESIPLALSYVASIDGSAREPFDVTGSNNSFKIQVGLTTVLGTIPTGAAQGAGLVAGTIASALIGAGTDATAEAYLSPVKFEGVVDVTTVGPTSTFTLQGGQFDGLGLALGDYVQIFSGPDIGDVFAINGLDLVAPSTFFTTSSVGVTPATGIRIQIGPPGRKVRVKCTNPTTAISSRLSLSPSSEAPYLGFSALLGFPAGGVFISKPSHARDVVIDYNSKATKSIASSARTSISTLIALRSRIDTNNVVVLYRFRATGDTVGGVGSVVVNYSAGGLLAAGLIVGDRLVLRGGQTPETLWVITVVTDTSITATGGTSVTESAVDFEVGPNLGAAIGALVIIDTGPNAGEYYVGALRSIPFELTLEATLPVFKIGSQPAFFTGSVNQEHLRVASRSVLQNSFIKVNGIGSMSFNAVMGFGGLPGFVWIKLPSWPTDLRVGDFVDVFLSSYSVPDETLTIIGLEQSLLLIQLGTTVPGAAPFTLPFSSGPVPFVRLRSSRVSDFTSLQTKLLAWASRPEQQAAFFTDLNRFVNPLLVTENPTKVQIDDATNKIFQLVNGLDKVTSIANGGTGELTLTSAIDDYVVTPLPEVDALLRSFKEKGSDRAIDLLIEGQFTTFFSLDLDDSSYLGDMQKKMRTMAREDLPVRKSGRDEASASPPVATIDDTDFEHDHSDITDVAVDPPPEQLDE